MSAATVAVLRHYFRFRLYVVSFNIVLYHNLLCGQIGLSEPINFIEAIPLCDNISFLYVPSYTTICCVRRDI